MPELPDLEIFARNLNAQLKGKKLKSITVKRDKKINVPAAELQQQLEGKVLEQVSREGKELYFRFGKQTLMSMHLMLHGELYLDDGSQEPKYILVQFVFGDGQVLSLTDRQRMARLSLNPAEETSPDALDKTISKDFFAAAFRNKKGAVKNILLDQQVIRGIGNAYADEILWAARISPFSSAKMIPGEKLEALAAAVRKVLEHAVKAIAKASPDRIRGEFRDFLKIHHTGKDTSPSGADIQVSKNGSRKTYYTSEQELFD